jgi:hypothetical protein
LTPLLAALLAATAAVPAGLTPVPREQIVEAMRASKGYDITATTNSGRFQADVLLRLCERGQAGPLFVGHREWFEALLEVRSLTAERAPVFARLANEYGQDMALECRTERVVEAVTKGPKVKRALGVRIAWPATNGKGESYSFEDLLSRPTLQVTNHREVTFRLVDFGDRILLDAMDGLTGRPSSGALGLLFKMIGEGRVVQYRMTTASDGVQVSRGRARKAFFDVESTVTVQPDGKAEKDTPADRADLQALDKRLQEPLDVKYRPLDVKLY